MNEQSQHEEERENLSGSDDCEAYQAEQEALPAHKRDGYVSMMYEASDDARKEVKENKI